MRSPPIESHHPPKVIWGWPGRRRTWDLRSLTAFSGTPGWPMRLRIHRITNTEIYSLTWNFAAPDGLATVHLDKIDEGQPLLLWRRIGYDAIYKNP
jgi:hypothetical protein